MEEIKLYRPSNSTEGDWFDHKWCEHCERDKLYRDADDPNPDDGCQIIARSFAYSIGDQQYPREWRYVDGEPTCTAFMRKGDKRQTPRCERTGDLFDD